jgi:predicted aspartyl protease
MSDLESILARMRSALRLGPWPVSRGRAAIAGSGQWYGTDVSHRLEFDARGRFVRRIDGRLSRAFGFDGDVAWDAEPGGTSRALELDERESLLLSIWVQTGFWLAADAPVDVALRRAEPGDIELSLRVRGGKREATLVVDGESMRPRRLATPSLFGEQTWTFESWRDADEPIFPGRVVQTLPAGVSHVLDASSVGERRAAGRFSMPEHAPRDVRFDPGVPPRVEVERAPTGHLLVRPRIDGRDVGWFILDTGAAVPVISREAADAIGLSPLGNVYAAGAGPATRAAALREGTGFELGPIEIAARLFYTELDLSAMAGPLGRPVAGVIGWDLFTRAVVVVDMASQPRVEIHDPSAFCDDGLAWQPMSLHGRHPHVRARVDRDHEGLFRIDTGGGGAGLFFHAPAAQKLGFAGREGQEIELAGAGGRMKALLSTVESFEIAGVRLEKPPAIFVAAGHGAFDDPYSLGTIAGGILDRFVMTFDHARRRVALTARSTA